MKKVLLILVLMSASLFAQSAVTKFTTTIPDDYNYYKGSALLLYNPSTGVYYSPINANGTLAIGQVSSTNFYALADTSTADTTTISFGFTSKHIGINNDETGGVLDSTTLYISTTNAFGLNTTYLLYAGESLSLDYGITALYIKWGKTTLYANKKSRFIVN